MSSSRSRSGGSAIGNDVEPVVEIRAESPLGDRRLAGCCCVAATTRTSTRRRLRRADALELAFLQHAQQLRLQRRRAARRSRRGRACRRSPARSGPVASRDRAGERAALVAEELALDERRRQRGAVDRDERPLRRGAPFVNRAREQFLAGAGLPDQQTDASVEATS